MLFNSGYNPTEPKNTMSNQHNKDRDHQTLHALLMEVYTFHRKISDRPLHNLNFKTPS